MAEYSENQVLKNQEAAVGDYPGIDLVEEYFDEDKPDYLWETAGNLIACLQFSDKKQIVLDFQKFILENQEYARNTDKLTKLSQRDIEEWELARQEEITMRKLLENIDIEAEDKEEYEPIEEENRLALFDNPQSGEDELQFATKNSPEDIEIKYKRSIWKRGVVVDYPIQDDNDKRVYVPVEIMCDFDLNLIFVKVGNNEILAHKRKALMEIMNILTYSPEIEQYAICNCPLCQESEKVEHGTAYSIPYSKLKNFQNRFVPKIQCYASGKSKRLDEISIIERPEIKVAIIHEPKSDQEFCDKTHGLFKHRELREKIWDITRIPLGKNVIEETKERLSESEIFIVIVSPNLISDDGALAQVENIINRTNGGTALLLGIIARDISLWEDCHPFNLSEKGIHIISEKSISSMKKHEIDESWKKIGLKLHEEIEKWLNVTRRYKLEKK